MSNTSLIGAIQSAFRHARSTAESPPRSISHRDAVEFLRSKLISLSEQDFEYCLPLVLIELLESHTNDPYNTEGADDVLNILDVEPAPPDFEWEKQEFGDEAATYSAKATEELRNIRRRLFTNFTPQQAQAISAFLSEVETWRDYETIQDVLRSAKSYWQRRASGQ